MVDTERRKLLSTHLRRLSTGQITNDDFEELVMDDVSYGWLPEQYYRSIECQSDDTAIRPVLEMAWCLYDDTRNHNLKGKDALSGFAIKEIARCILFLMSDQEYTWNYVDMTHPIMRFSFTDMMKSILTFGQHYRNVKQTRQQEYEQMKKSGDFELWPFKTKAQFEEQLEKQPFLNGIKND
jgi:hypothetical protein